MHDLNQRDHLHSINPTYQSNSRCIETDFKFLDQPRSDDGEIEFQTQANQCLGSPPLWARKASRDKTHEVSRLLHHYSFPSPARRSQAIVDSRRALMGTIQTMPESSFELSLKDIVDDKQSMEEVQEEAVMEESSHKGRTKVKVAQKNKNTKEGQILRTESMDSGVFLLKMFVPMSLGSKKKSDRKTCSRISPKPSPERADKCKCISRSTTSISKSTQGLSASYFLPGWWSFKGEKRKSRRQRGCLF